MAGLIGIVLEREELQILHAIMLTQVKQESTKPRGAALGVGPDLDVIVHALKGRTTELETGIYLAYCCYELEIERSVVFGLRILAIGFFSYLDIGDGVFVVFEVTNFGGGIVGCFVEQGNRHHRGKAACHPALKEEIEANLGFVPVDFAIVSVPRVDG